MKPIHILLIEDNEGDIMLTLEGLEDSRVTNKTSVIRDGEAAIHFFETVKKKDEVPDLVLLDVNLPRKSGHEVLRYIKNSEKYNQLPVIMLTTSSAQQDILLAYKHYANCYITKPIEVTEFMNAVTKIKDFWINIVTIPKE